MVLLSSQQLFFCGGEVADAYIFHLNNEQLEKRCDMNYARGEHGLIKLNAMIYVFGGGVRQLQIAEMYDLDIDTWTVINNKLPEKMVRVH